MKKLYAVSYLLFLCATLVNGHNPEEVNWDHKTFDTLSECMSGNVSDRTQSNCGKIIGEWVKANRNDFKNFTTTEIAPKKDNNYIYQIKIKGKEYDKVMKKLYASSNTWWRKRKHKINSNPFVCTHDEDVIAKKLLNNFISSLADLREFNVMYSLEEARIRGRHLNKSLCRSLYENKLSYDMAQPSYLTKFFIPYALKQLENKRIDDENTIINYSDDP